MACTSVVEWGGCVVLAAGEERGVTDPLDIFKKICPDNWSTESKLYEPNDF